MQAPMQAMLALIQKPRGASEILAKTKRDLEVELLEKQRELRDLSQTAAQDRWTVELDIESLQDDEARLVAQITLIEELETNPAQQMAKALEELLRARFRRVDEIEATVQGLPTLDSYEEATSLSTEELATCEHVRALEHEQFKLDRQIDLLARFLGIQARRIYEMRQIIGAFHEDEETRKLCQREEAATCYLALEQWMQGTATIKQLSFPEHLVTFVKPEEDNIALVVA
jgi:hypothetical protein